jgi:DNA repair protein RecN (Recombination protein N)
VAAAADHHFTVAKEVMDGLTHTRVSQLRDTRGPPGGTGGTGRGDSGEARSYAASLLKSGSMAWCSSPQGHLFKSLRAADL